MIDLKETAEFLSLNFNKLILFNLVNETFVATSNLELLRAEGNHQLKGNKIVNGKPEYLKDVFDNPDNYVPLFEYSDQDFKDNIKYFYEKILKESYEGITIPKFKKILKTNIEIKEKWIEYFSVDISFEFNYWVHDVNLRETEATCEQYKKIRDLFIRLHGLNFNRSFSDQHLFYLPVDYDYVYFVFLGNAGITDGIQFYFGEDGDDYYKNILMGEEGYAMVTLSQTFSIYYEDENIDDIKVNNPFGDDNKVTSIGFDCGVQYHCYCPKSLANKIIKYLENILVSIPEFVKSEEYGLVDINKQQNITLFSPAFVRDNENVTPESGIYDFEHDITFEIEKYNVIYKEVDITLDVLYNYYSPFDDEKIVLSSYVMLIANHKTKYIEPPIMEEPDFYGPFVNLYKAINTLFKSEGVPNIIHLSSFITFGFLMPLIKDLVDKKKIKIVVDDMPILTDIAFKNLNEELSKYIDKEADA